MKWALVCLLLLCAARPVDDAAPGRRGKAVPVRLLTSASDYDAGAALTTLTVPSVTVGSGRTLVVVTAGWGADVTASSGVTWGATSLTKADSYLYYDAFPDASFGEIWYKDGLTAGTHDVTVTTTDGKSSLVGVAIEVTGLTATSLDAVAHGNGTSTAPTSAAISTAQADEILIGLVTWRSPSTLGVGTWSGGFVDLGFASSGSHGASADMSLSVGYRVVSVTGSYSAAKSGADNLKWGAIVGGFKK